MEFGPLSVIFCCSDSGLQLFYTLGLVSHIFLFTLPHRFSMGFRSNELGPLSNSLVLFAQEKGENYYNERGDNVAFFHNLLIPGVLISLIQMAHTEERPQAVLSVSPQNWLTEGDSVTLSCEVTDSSTDWTFSWYTFGPHSQLYFNSFNEGLEPKLLSDSSRGSGGSYTLSPVALTHTGVYVCRGGRGEPVIYTEYSNEQPLWITGESPPVSLIISPNRTQHFTDDSLSLSCEDQSNSTGWTVRQYTDIGGVLDCSQWGSVTGSTCEFNSVSTSYTGVYWCESESGENSNPVNITVHERPQAVLSVSPQNWLTEGDSVTLSCEVTDSSTDWTFSWYTVDPHSQLYFNFFYKAFEPKLLSDSSRGSGGSYTLRSVALKHAGLYACRGARGKPVIYTEYSKSQPLWITGESPPVSLIISPNRTQHFTHDSLTLSCEDQSNSTELTLRRYTGSETLFDFLLVNSVAESTIEVNSLSTSYTGVYWCESESGENSNPVNITVHGEIALPRMIGKPVSSSDITRKPAAAPHGSCSPAPEHARVSALCTSERPMGFPGRFSGDAAEWSGFHCSIGKYIEVQSSQFPTEQAKITFFIFLLSGEALSCKMWSAYGGDFGSYAIITGHFMGMFGMTKADLGTLYRGPAAKGTLYHCPAVWESDTVSTCHISFLSTSYTGVYWCESESGENSNPVNITVNYGDVILESSVHPVTEGHPLTLHCLYRNTNPSNLRADFYKDGSVVQNQTTGEMIIHKVSKSDEGFYHCEYPKRGESLRSWISVRAQTDEKN
ncbi:Fc receptor-like protein 5 [Silurus asotus]|uniref:Fc receptor-like protein 5 n=1 Tax=Silurus asotus TaxID=30991 RepID=A0AAD5FNB2_SILAS|nr:Fc receptor-like protein 5 [Silurus asotus]